MQMGFFSIPEYYLLAFALGVVGQGMRGLLGVFKALRSQNRPKIVPYFFASTLMLGGLSGLMGALIYDLGAISPSQVTTEQLWNDRNFILMAVSAGYFGADVIEGILGRAAPHKNPQG